MKRAILVCAAAVLAVLVTMRVFAEEGLGQPQEAQPQSVLTTTQAGPATGAVTATQAVTSTTETTTESTITQTVITETVPVTAEPVVP